MKRIGKYTVETKIAAGGMGTIYKAFDPYFERTVAIKVMSPQLAADEEFRSRFFREARSTARLSHPNIVTVYDLGEEGGIPFLVMEYLDGQDLKSMILAHSRLSLEEQISIMTEVCRGLAHAHANGIIHRDVKPGNIFVSGGHQVKLLDFGLARGVASATLTSKGSILGTPSYMSPEQWANSKVDHRCDIFATGAVFYELLAQKKAFAGDTYEQIFYSIFHSDPESLQSINPALPSDICGIVHHALARDVESRYQHMQGLLDDLKACWDHLQSSKSVLIGELSTALRERERYIENNREFLVGTCIPAFASAAAPGDYLQLLESMQRVREERGNIESLVVRRKKAVPHLLEAGRLERDGMLEQALLVIDRLLAEDPVDARALAIRERLESRLEQLRAEHEKALQVALFIERAEASLAAGDPKGSLDLLHQALSLDPQNARALERKETVRRQEALRQRTMGLSLFAAREFRECIPALRFAREQVGEDPELDAALDKAELQVRQDDLRLLAESRLAEARALRAQDDLSDARDIIVRMLEADPGNSQAHDLLAEIEEAQTAKQREERIAVLQTQCRQALARREFETAGKRIDEALQVDGENRESRSLLDEIEKTRQSYEHMRVARRRVIAALAIAVPSLALYLFLNFGRRQESGQETKTVAESAVPSAEMTQNQRTPAGLNDQARPGKEIDRASKEYPAMSPVTVVSTTSTLTLNTNPAVGGAAVKIDSAVVGKTDATGTFTTSIRAGAPHVVEVEKEGYTRFLESLPPIMGGENKTVPVELMPSTPPRTWVSLNISSNPSDAMVYIDGAVHGQTPAQARLKPGLHKIEVKKKGYRTKERSTEWSAAEYNIEFSLERESGDLQIAADPKGAIATINGQHYESDPEKRIALAPGTHKVMISKDGYLAREFQVSISDGQTERLTAKLEKSALPAEEFGDAFVTLANWSAPPGWRADRQALVARGTGICWLKDRVFGNFTMKFSLRLTNGIASSWIIRAKDAANYYRIEIRGDAYGDPRLRNTVAFYICAAGEETEVKTLPIPVEGRKLRDWFQSFVEVQENRIRIQVSGKLLSGTNQNSWTMADFSDPAKTYSEGRIGFRVSGSDTFEVNGFLMVPSK